MNCLERLRTDRGLTRDALATAAGVSSATVYVVERAGVIPTAPIAKRLGDVLDLPASELVDQLRADFVAGANA